MTNLDINTWGIVAPNDDSGFGRMAAMLKSELGITRHIGIPSDRLPDHPLRSAKETWLDPKAADRVVERELDGLQGIIFFERCEWHPTLVQTAKKLGVKTVCVPMWEWFSGSNPTWNEVDLIACPSEWTHTVVQSYGYKQSTCMTWPLDVALLPERHVTGPAKLFVHNAGLVDVQDRKGTADTIRAFCKVKNSELRLIVRTQKEAKLPKGDSRIDLQIGNICDLTELYRDGDVAIQPSKMEGIGFMVLEPFCCGIPTITTDYPPMNEYVTDPRMLVKPQWGKRKAFPTTWIPHAHLRIPQNGDLVRKIQWCAENDLSEISKANRKTALEMYDRPKVQKEWYQALECLLQ